MKTVIPLEHIHVGDKVYVIDCEEVYATDEDGIDIRNGISQRTVDRVDGETIWLDNTCSARYECVYATKEDAIEMMKRLRAKDWYFYNCDAILEKLLRIKKEIEDGSV